MSSPKIDERIAAWQPAHLEHGDPDQHLAFVRAVVADALPRTDREARSALTYCSDYTQWLSRRQHQLNAATAFTDELVADYRDEMLSGRPKGTADAICSHLRRFDPTIGLAGTTRKNGHAKATAQQPEPPGVAAATELEPVELSPATEAAILSFEPTTLDGDRWNAVADVVRQAVTNARPDREQRARDLLRSFAYLAAWADHEHRPIRIDALLDGTTIEAFIAVVAAAGMPNRSVGTFSSNLHALREANGLPLTVTRRQVRRDSAKHPYDSDQVEAFFRQARRIPSSARRRHAHAALVLIFGAGVKPGVCGWLPPGSIIDRGDQVLVRAVRPERWNDRLSYDDTRLAAALGLDGAGVAPERIRSVVALDNYAEALRQVRHAAEKAGDSLSSGGRALDATGGSPSS